MWPLRQQQRRLGSKNCVDPWHVPSCFLVFLADRRVCLRIADRMRRAAAHFIGIASEKLVLNRLLHCSVLRQPMTASGHSRPIDLPPEFAACPLHP